MPQLPSAAAVPSLECEVKLIELGKGTFCPLG
jgi:hypothetical protein